MPLTDEQAATLAIKSLENLSPQQQAAQHRIYEIIKDESDSPFVDVHELFQHYNALYFRGRLLPRVEVSWSKRLTLCAGICELSKDDEGKYRRIRIKLSEPLLQYRPRFDVINVLLHEAIHAYFLITASHIRSDDPSGHGAGFQALSAAINQHGASSGLEYEITIFHTFDDEVDSYRTHVWQCDGPCKEIPPHFGLVKRSMNRPPGKHDSWWESHQEECGGTFAKVAEPELTREQRKRLSQKERAGLQKNKISEWVVNRTGSPEKPSASKDAKVGAETSKTDPQKAGPKGSKSPKRKLSKESMSIDRFFEKRIIVNCPICDSPVQEQEINGHLDLMHPP